MYFSVPTSQIEVLPVTDRRHAGDDTDVPGLEDTREDTDPANSEKVDERLPCGDVV